MKIAVLGVGLIGGSIGLAARKRLGAEVAGHDSDPATLESAIDLGAIDRGASIADACRDAEIVFCAAPVGVLEGLVAEALASAGPEAVVTDVGSTKRALVSAHGGDQRFVGGHPLAGAETSGVSSARDDLFDGARWYLTPTTDSSGVVYDRLQRAIADLGARPQAIDPEEHDRQMAAVSHLPHVIANVLVAEALAASGGDRLPEAGPSLRDTIRVAGANPGLWGDIFASNSEAVAGAIDRTVERLRSASELIRSADPTRVAAWQAEAAESRRRLVAAGREGGELSELRIAVENRPGTVAELALALGEAGVNIEDMALYPAADMRSGAISVWVAGAGEVERATELVRGLGHQVTVVDLD